MTVFVTMPSSLLKDFDNGDDFQLCRQGCPTYERLDLPGTNPLGVPAMDKYKARALCKEYNITDYYLDSCIFDLMTTDDMSFRIAAQVALRDHWTQDPIGAKRQLQNCSEPPCVWEVTSMAHIAWPSWVTRLSTLIIVIMNLKSKL
ncbi:hypothetical protein SK128_003424 [Halocaridina rubra]|uniref:Repulsive guidance molecule C-terminal domain-containing protein n=1 Tax=Halocaridina rubra TaxID=373956 RepID=A0AAN8ZZC9_HALRR